MEVNRFFILIQDSITPQIDEDFKRNSEGKVLLTLNIQYQLEIKSYFYCKPVYLGNAKFWDLQFENIYYLVFQHLQNIYFFENAIDMQYFDK